MTTDLFEKKSIAPMLIGASSAPFDSSDHIFELKMDGIRCIVYLDRNGTELRNKRNFALLPRFPELADLNHGVTGRCILDGELIVAVEGKPKFYEVQRRTIIADPFKIRIASVQFPATFVAFDILYANDDDATKLPLLERKALLSQYAKDTGQLSVARYIEQSGIAFYRIVEAQELEGIVAKRKDSLYYFGRRTTEWQKIKYLQDDDFVVLGYIGKENHMNSIILGKYRDGHLIYKGHVTLGVSGPDFVRIRASKKLSYPPTAVPHGNETAAWVAPEHVCTVQYMELSAAGSMRQPVFKGLRTDKLPSECTEK